MNQDLENHDFDPYSLPMGYSAVALPKLFNTQFVAENQPITIEEALKRLNIRLAHMTTVRLVGVFPVEVEGNGPSGTETRHIAIVEQMEGDV